MGQGPDYDFDFLCRGLVDTEVLQCEKAVAPRGGHALCLTIQCSTSHALQKLGQKVMDGELERVLNTRLRAKGWRWPVQLDRTRFAELTSSEDQAVASGETGSLRGGSSLLWLGIGASGSA